jgi:hypothetical protein
MSGALPVVGEAVELATGGAGSRTGERFFFIDIQAVKEYPLFFWVMISEGFIKSRGEIFV